MEELLLILKENDIDVSVENDNLVLDIPNDFDANDILVKIKENKAELISYISEQKKICNTYSKIEKVNIKEYYKLSSAQNRLYFLYEYDKNSLIYNVSNFLTLKGNVDLKKVEEVFNQLIIRHESLRTVFVTINGEFFQKVLDKATIELEFFKQSNGKVEEIFTNFIKPFDLSQAPLLRVGIIEISTGNHVLMIDMHHIITDGVSCGFLVKDFMTLYNNDSLPELQIQYKDFAEWQQSATQQKEIFQQREFWIKEFEENYGTLELQTDFPRPLIKTYRGQSVDFDLSIEETSKLRSIAKSEETTMFMLTLSIFKILLSKLSNTEDIVVGIPIAGREHPDLERIIGVFINTLPIRSNPKGDSNFSDFLSTLKSKSLECFENQAYPYEELINELKIERDSSHNPLFDVMFVYQNFEMPELKINELTLEPYKFDHLTSKFDITLTSFEKENQISFKYEYSTELYRKETIERFIKYFQNIVSTIINDVTTPIKDIEIITDFEKRQLLYEFNNNQTNYPKEKTIQKLFEEQVQENPNRISITVDNNNLTYAELNSKVNQMARFLMKSGIYSEDIVLLYLDRTIDVIIGTLAILKSGGAYLPVDKAYPTERIKKIIENSQPKIIICRGEFDIEMNNECQILNLNDICYNVEDNNNIALKSKPNSLAYIIYTSGSPFKPKSSACSAWVRLPA